MGANATTSVPTYVAGEVLTAADLNVTNSGIPVFADSTARTNGFGGTGEKTLAEGQYAYLEDDNKTYVYDGSSWKEVGGAVVVQVKSTIKTDSFSMSSSTFADVTGLSVSVTPTSASNKILVVASVNGQNDPTANSMYVRLVRDSTSIAVGDAAGSRAQASAYLHSSSSSEQASASISILDSPATTSATTYKIQVATNNNSGTCYINRTAQDTNASTQARTASTITVFEVTP